MDQRLVECAELLRLLKSPQSMQMLAPRRIGKTWLLHRLEDDLKDLGWRAVFIDVEGMRTEEEFLRELCTKLDGAGSFGARFKAHFSQRFANLLGGEWDGNVMGAIGKLDAKRFSETLIESLDQEGVDTVILVDEIALFVLARLKVDVDATRDFLYHLRKLCQTYPRVRWIFTGSIGLDAVARRYDLGGALLDLTIFPLEPLSPEGARALLDRLSSCGKVRRPFALDDAGLDHLARELGWLSPYYLEKLANEIVPTGPGQASGLPLATVADIDRAFAELLRPHFRAYFSAWEEHLRKNFEPADEAAMESILRLLCANRDGETAATIAAHLAAAGSVESPDALQDRLNWLLLDGFVEEVDGRWRFVSGLLRRYWERYHGA